MQRAGNRPEAVPLYSTERNPQRETTGGRVAAVGQRMMGTPFMPWQRLAADIAHEVDPATGLPWYTEVLAIILRQTGKTTWCRAELVETCLYVPHATTRYTAQNRTMALTRLEGDFWRPISESPLRSFLDARIGRRTAKPGLSGKGGQEHIGFVNSAGLWIDSVKSTSGHGPTLDKGVIDEAFAHQDARIEQAMTPAMATVPHAQLFIMSAAGDHSSTYLRNKVELARARVQMESTKPLHERRSRTAYIEYAAPADADRADPETWWRYHPALGHTITQAKIEAALESFAPNPEDFDRAYLGWWPKRKQKELVIPAVAWEDDVTTHDLTFTGEPVWGIDVSPERDWASIGMAGAGMTGRVFVEHIDRRPGTEWLLSRMVHLRTQHGGSIVALDPGTASDSLITDLQDKGFTVRQCAGRHKMQAVAGFHDDAVAKGQLTHVNDGELNQALEDAVKLRSSGENGFLWSRGRSFGDITPLYAVTFARWAFVEFAAGDYDVLDSVG